MATNKNGVGRPKVKAKDKKTPYTFMANDVMLKRAIKKNGKDQFNKSLQILVFQEGGADWDEILTLTLK